MDPSPQQTSYTSPSSPHTFQPIRNQITVPEDSLHAQPHDARTPSPLHASNASGYARIDTKKEPTSRFVPPPLPRSRNIDRVRQSLLDQKAEIERGLAAIEDMEKQRAGDVEDQEMIVDDLFRSLFERIRELYLFDDGDDGALEQRVTTFLGGDQLLQSIGEIQERVRKLPSTGDRQAPWEKTQQPEMDIDIDKDVGIDLQRDDLIEERMLPQLSERQRRGITKANQRLVQSLRGIRARRYGRGVERRKVSPSSSSSISLGQKHAGQKEHLSVRGFEATLEEIKAAARKAVVSIHIEACLTSVRKIVSSDLPLLKIIYSKLCAILRVLEAAALFRQRKNISAHGKMSSGATLWQDALTRSAMLRKERSKRVSTSSSESTDITEDISREDERLDKPSTPVPEKVEAKALVQPFDVRESSDSIGSVATNYNKLVCYCFATSPSAALFLAESIAAEMEQYVGATT